MMSAIVGYRLESVDGDVITSWGGVWGQCPAIPNEVKTLAGDIVAAPSLNTEYGGVVLVEWTMDAPHEDFKAKSQAELDASDTTVLRCVENNIAVPVAWRDYRDALRKIVKTGDGPMPDRPPYPSNT